MRVPLSVMQATEMLVQGEGMSSPATRKEMIENLLQLVREIDVETEAGIQLEAQLLTAYSLVEIERHLANQAAKTGD
jgi:hypothetical protein